MSHADFESLQDLLCKCKVEYAVYRRGGVGPNAADIEGNLVLIPGDSTVELDDIGVLG